MQADLTHCTLLFYNFSVMRAEGQSFPTQKLNSGFLLVCPFLHPQILSFLFPQKHIYFYGDKCKVATRTFTDSFPLSFTAQIEQLLGTHYCARN